MTETRSVVRIGTRASQLALAQARFVRERLEQRLPDCQVKLVKIRTTGDRVRQAPLAAVGGEGLFTREIQRALQENRIDAAVHSLKDLPTQSVEGLTLAAIPERLLPNDVLVARSGHSLLELPMGAVVGTGSIRRRAQLLDRRPDLEVKGIRGNVDTRLRKLRAGDADAIILAYAGLHRLGLEGEITELLPFDTMLPAAGQGALGVEMRADDPRRPSVARALHHELSAAAVSAEREVLSRLGGGCHIPVGVLCEVKENGTVRLRAALAAEPGSPLRRADAAGSVEDVHDVIDEVLRRLA